MNKPVPTLSEMCEIAGKLHRKSYQAKNSPTTEDHVNLALHALNTNYWARTATTQKMREKALIGLRYE